MGGFGYAPGEGGYFGWLYGPPQDFEDEQDCMAYRAKRIQRIDWDLCSGQKQACKRSRPGKATTDEKEVGDGMIQPKSQKNLTTALIEQNYDVFVLESDASDAGIVSGPLAMPEKRAKSVWAISYVSDKNYLAPDFHHWRLVSAFIWKMMENSAIEYGKAGKPVSEKLVPGSRTRVHTN